MAKPNRRHTSRKPKASKPNQVTSSQKTTIAAIWVLCNYLAVAPIIPTIDLMVHVKEIDSVTQNLMAICFGLYGAITIGTPQLKQRIRTAQNVFTNAKAHRATRRMVVALLAIYIFANIAMWIPVFYLKGYVTVVMRLLPTQQEFGAKAGIALSFVLGAITSGVLGNLAYDIIRFAVLKSKRKSKN